MSETSQPAAHLRASHRSLRAWARREAHALSRVPRLRRWRNGLVRAVRALWSNDVLLALGALAVFPLLFATANHWFPVLPSVSPLKDREQYLFTLWQVLAAALALSIAVVLFAFQANATEQTRTSLKEFAQDSHVMQLFYVSLPSLIVVGLTLLSAGSSGEPSLQRTSLALFSAGLAFLALPGMLMFSVRALDPGTRHNRRLNRIRRTVHAAVDQEVRLRLADGLLRQLAGSWSLGYLPGPFRGPVPAGFEPVSMQRAGEVRDLRLRRLAKVVGTVGPANLHLVTRIGDSLTGESPITWIRQGLAEAPRHVRQLSRVMRLSPNRPSNLNIAIDSLHNEGMSHILAQRKTEYEDVAKSYQELLLSFPAAWFQYGTAFDPAIAQGLSLFPGDLDRVVRNLYEELHRALQQGGREVASVVAGIPLGVARGAIPYGATVLIRDMLRLLRDGYRICRLEPNMTLASVMEQKFINLIVEFAKYFVLPGLDDGRGTDEALDRASGALEVTFAAIRDTLKLMLDGQDFEALANLDGEWSELLRFWNPEYAEVRAATLALHLQGVSDLAKQQRLRESAQRNEDAATRKQRLLDFRDDQRFSLAVWSLRQWLAGEEPDFYRRAFERFAADFNSLEMVSKVADRAIRYDASELPVWVDWIMFQETRGHALDTLSPAQRTFVVLAALRVPVPLGTTTLQPYQFLQSGKDALLQIATQVRADQQLQALVGDWEIRLDSLARLIERASEERAAQDRAELAAAEVDLVQVGAFRDSLRAGWASGRLGHALHARYGRVATDQGPKPGLVWPESHWLPKGLFLAGRYLDSSLAEDLGLRLAQTEMVDFMQALGRAAEAVPVQEVFERRLEDAIQELHAAGYRPHVLLAPVSSLLRQRLFPGYWPAQAEVPSWLPEKAGHWYIGTRQDLICLEWPELPVDKVYLVDMLHFSEFRQWEGPDEHLVEFRIKTYDAIEAEAAAQQRTELFAKEGRDEHGRAEEIQQHVAVTALVRHAVTVMDLGGARSVAVPAEVQES